MIQFTCGECGGDRWLVHGGATLDGPTVEQLECAECGNREEVGA